MSAVVEGDKIFAAPAFHEPAVVPGTVERTGPTAFLWRGDTRAISGLALLSDEGYVWCRGDEESRDALVAARRLILSEVR
jgi:hypothetical protein